MSSLEGSPRAVIFGCSAARLTPDEAAFFRDADPLGFILFARNIVDPHQVRGLVASLRETVGRDAPILIDQEGGRVQRLRPPHWRAAPPAARLAGLSDASERAVWLNARLIAAELAALGIDVDCAPVLDVPVPGAHAIIGDRAHGGDPTTVARLGRVVMAALLAGGVLPVIKHIPGHGRAEADSHESCPVVNATAAALEANDLPPFRALADAPFAMTAHVVYRAWDAERVATLSPIVIDRVIREAIGFSGALMSDDLGMGALSGSLAGRASGAIAAGCDVTLHCDGKRPDMIEIAGAVPRLTGAALDRIDRALARRHPPEAFDAEAAHAELGTLLTGV